MVNIDQVFRRTSERNTQEVHSPSSQDSSTSGAQSQTNQTVQTSAPPSPDKNSLRITILGNTSSGKTCFLLGMYGGMTEGFQLYASDHQQRTQLDELWSRLLSFGYIEGTAQYSDFNFVFLDSKMELARFFWSDYRGGILDDSRQAAESEVNQLKSLLSESQCLFLCISGEHLQHQVTQKNLTQIREQAKLTILFQYLHDYAKSKQVGRLSPVVITISKYDYCLSRKPDLLTDNIAPDRKSQLLSELESEIERDIKLLFEPLFKKPVFQPGWLVMICPFTLGKGFCEEQFVEARNSLLESLLINPNSNYVDIAQGMDYIPPAVEPANFHLPFVFALWAILREEAWDLREKLYQIEEILSYIPDPVLNGLSENPFTLEQRLDEIIMIINNKLLTYLQEAMIYKDGERITISEIHREKFNYQQYIRNSGTDF